jgi:hypothetical protein
MYKYRITVNNSISNITNTYPQKQWENIFQTYDNRGGIKAKFEKRLITDKSILSLLTNTKGYITLKDKVISPWETIAELI